MQNLGKKSLKTPTKSRCGRVCTKLPTELPDANESLDKEVTSKLKTNDESKNGLKDQIKLEDEPCSSQEIQSANPDVPPSVIDKIKKILIQYNFLNMEEGTDVKGLVEILQKVILASLKGDPAKTCDDLTERIAKVLFETKTRSDQPTDSSSTSLEKEPTAGSNAEPASSDTNSQNDGDNLQNDGGNGNRTKRKRDLEKEDTPMTEDTAAPSTKKIRKAALRAKEKLDSIDSVITINNDDDDWTMEENNSILAAILKRGKNKAAMKNTAYEKEKRRSRDSIASDDAIAERKNDSPVKAVRESTKQTPDKERPSRVMSILVSDDDDDVIIKAHEPEKRREVEKECPQNLNRDDDIQNDEQIPLHASLLTNQNFIKIVAHTYLSQNVMLDENAALLAAQYSAQSALKAIQAGKQIYSGPIYDIAVNVVGINILKQLHSSLKTTDSVKMNQKENIEGKPSTSQTNLKSIEVSKTDQPKKCKADKKLTPASVSAKRAQQRQNSSDSDDLVLVESTRADEPRRRKCYANNRLRGKVSSEDSKSTTKGSKDKKKLENTTTVSSNVTSPKTEALLQKIFPVQRITCGERQTSQTSNSSISATMVANDDDDVRVVDNPATPESRVSNLRRRNSQPMIINSVRATDKPLSGGPTKICKENSTVKSSQMTNTTAKPSMAAVDAETTLIIPDIDLDEDITVASAKGKTNMQSSQTRICPKLKSPSATVSTVEAPLIISDIDLDDDPIEYMEHSELINKKSSAGKSSRMKMRESLIVPDIDLDDDIIEHMEKTERMTKDNPTIKSSKRKKGATMRDSLIIPDIDLDDDIIEHTEQTKSKTRKAPVDKLSQKKKSPTVRESLIIPDIDLDDDIIEHTEQIETTTKKCAAAKFGQTKKAPATNESLIIPDIDLDEVSTPLQKRTEAATEPEATKGPGSETICLDSDDEEAIVIKESAEPPIPDVVLSNKTMSHPTASAANIKTHINPASCIEVHDDTDIDLKSSRLETEAKSATYNAAKRCNTGIVQLNEDKGKIFNNGNTNATLKADTKFVKNIKTVPGDGNKQASKDLPQTSLADDPLRVLQDVIHISADNFDVIDISQTKETPTSKQRNRQSNTDDPQRDAMRTKHSQISHSSAQASTKSAHTLLLKIQEVKDYIMSKPTSSSSSNSVNLTNTNKDTGYKKIFTVGATNSRNSNGEGRLVEQIDAKKIGPISVVGSAKDIMISGKVGKNLLKPSTVQSTSKTIKNKESIKSEASQFAGGKKRPMTSNNPGPAKKIKPETRRQLTLKDFNIDDIDDIIELE